MVNIMETPEIDPEAVEETDWGFLDRAIRAGHWWAEHEYAEDVQQHPLREEELE
jgi:hypothetical protein